MPAVQLVIYPISTLLVAAALMPIVKLLEDEFRIKRFKELTSIGALGLTLALLLGLVGAVREERFIEASLAGFGLPMGVQLYVDGFSIYMAMIFCGLGLLVAIFSYRYMEVDTGLEKYYGLLLTLVAGMIGVAFSGDLFNLYVFWELMCISSYTLVSFRKYRWEAVEAGFKYLVISTIGSLIALYGISLVYGLFKTLNMREIALRLTDLKPQPGGSAILTLYLAVILIICGFAVTAALVPFHTWLPDAHPAAPASISAMLSGVVIKTGVYAISRITFTSFTTSPFRMFAGLAARLIPVVDHGSILIALGVITITFANIVVIMQRDLKRFLAYSSIVNMGYIAAGFGITAYLLHHYPGEVQAATLAVTAASGAILHILNHAVGKGLLFLFSGCVVHEAKTRDLAKIEGIGRKMPWTGVSASIGLLHLAGVPPLAGFWSKLFIIWGGLGLPGDPILLVSSLIIVVNSVYAAGYYLWLMQRLMLGKPTSTVERAQEAPASMAAPIVILALACLAPTVLLNWLLPGVREIALALITV